MLLFKTSDHTEHEIINKTLETLKRGGLVVYPSDTVYGLLVDSTNTEAVEKLIAFKERPHGKAISVFVSDFEMMEEYVRLEKNIKHQLQQFLPGTYTIVLPSRHKTSQLLESEKGTLGVRYISHPLVSALVSAFGKPITATSANLASKPPHYSIDTFLEQTSQKRLELIDLVVDDGKLPYRRPSTVLDYTQDTVKTLRIGEESIKSKSNNILISKNAQDTKNIAKGILKNIKPILKDKPVVIILKGELGAGKTIFVKGIGEALQISDMVSPTYVIYYEYPVSDKDVKNVIHIDLYNVQDAEEFKHLGIERYLVPHNLLCIEWGEKSAEIIDKLQEKAHIIYIHIKHQGESTREILIQNSL